MCAYNNLASTTSADAVTLVVRQIFMVNGKGWLVRDARCWWCLGPVVGHCCAMTRWPPFFQMLGLDKSWFESSDS